MVIIFGLEEASHDVVHGGLGVLRCHVEPNASRHRQSSVLVDELRVFQQVKLAVVGARGDDVGELAVVVAPRELERPSAVVLLASSGWPGSR